MNVYSLLIGVGSSLGLLQVAQRVPAKQALRWTIAGAIQLIIALVGARAAYVMLFPDYYTTHPQAAWQITQGGLAWPGALIGGLLGFIVGSLLLHAPFGLAADVFARLYIPVAITSWLGAAFSGVAYGMEIYQGIPWAVPSTQPDGVLTYRWPLQLTAALTLLYIAWRFDRRSADWRLPEARAALTGLLLAGHTALFSYWRADGGLVYNGLRVDYAAAALLGGICLLGLLTRLVLRIINSFRDEAPGANRETWFSPRE